MEKLVSSATILALTIVMVGCASGGGEWPDRPIEVSVGNSAGGTSDNSTRALASALEEELGVSLQVTNVEGANGGVNAEQINNAPADGYRIGGGSSVHGVWPVMDQAGVGWEDFYAFLLGFVPTTIYVAQDSPYETLEDLLTEIEQNPGSLQYGTPGPGSNGEIFGSLLIDAAGLPDDAVVHVPYGGGREAGQFLISGEVDFASVTRGDVIDFAVGEQIRPLADLSEEETEFEGITFPSVVEDFPELESYTAINPGYGVYLPRETPPEIVEQFSAAFLAATEQEELRSSFEEELAGDLEPALGQESDEIMSQIESARGWSLYELGVAPNDPSETGIPRIEEWSWPPHERAEEAEPWPEDTEASARVAEPRGKE